MKLRRSRKDLWFAGVCGGLAAAFDLDAGRLRIVWVVGTILLVMSGWLYGLLAALVIYLTFCFLIPMEARTEQEFKAPLLQPWKGIGLTVRRGHRKKSRSICER